MSSSFLLLVLFLCFSISGTIWKVSSHPRKAGKQWVIWLKGEPFLCWRRSMQYDKEICLTFLTLGVSTCLSAWLAVSLFKWLVCLFRYLFVSLFVYQNSLFYIVYQDISLLDSFFCFCFCFYRNTCLIAWMFICLFVQCWVPYLTVCPVWLFLLAYYLAPLIAHLISVIFLSVYVLILPNCVPIFLVCLSFVFYIFLPNCLLIILVCLPFVFIFSTSLSLLSFVLSKYPVCCLYLSVEFSLYISFCPPVCLSSIGLYTHRSCLLLVYPPNYLSAIGLSAHLFVLSSSICLYLSSKVYPPSCLSSAGLSARPFVFYWFVHYSFVFCWSIGE